MPHKCAVDPLDNPPTGTSPVPAASGQTVIGINAAPVVEDGISGAGGAGQAPFELECTPNGEYGRHSRDWRLIGLKHRVGVLFGDCGLGHCGRIHAVWPVL